jgi:dihydroorotase
MHESILIKDVDIVLEDTIKKGDVFIEEGQIVAIEPNLPEHADLVIDEQGLTLMPGVIDGHVHFREPGAEYKEGISSGSRAAAAGGVTSFLEMPNTNPATTTQELISQKKQLAAEKSLVNYNFFIGATKDNLSEIQKVENVAGVKLFMGSSTGDLLVDNGADLERLFSSCGKLIAVHAEDEQIIKSRQEEFRDSDNPLDHLFVRPDKAEIEAVERALILANKYQTRVHFCHLTTEDACHLVNMYKEEDHITAEVTPQHLLCSAPDIYERFGYLAKVNPPIREQRHQKALCQALDLGVIDMIATDHAPHMLNEKNGGLLKAMSGMPGIETSLPLMLNQVNLGKITINQLVNWMCHGPAQVFNIQNKGKIELGYDADLVLVNLKAKRRIENRRLYTKAGWSVFNGQELVGWPIATFVNGQMVFREGDFFEGSMGRELQIG